VGGVKSKSNNNNNNNNNNNKVELLKMRRIDRMDLLPASGK